MTNRRTWQTALLWVVALVIVNALWLNVVDQSAPNEINAENQFQTHREIDISSVFGNDDPIPAELTTRFSSTSLDNANLSVAIKKDNLTDALADQESESHPRGASGHAKAGVFVLIFEVVAIRKLNFLSIFVVICVDNSKVRPSVCSARRARYPHLWAMERQNAPRAPAAQRRSPPTEVAWRRSHARSVRAQTRAGP